MLPALFVVAGVPKAEGWLVPGVEPNGEAAAPPVEAPALPNRPPPVDPLLLFWFEPKVLPDVPKRPPLEAPLEVGPPKENDMAMYRDRRIQAWGRQKNNTSGSDRLEGD